MKHLGKEVKNLISRVVTLSCFKYPVLTKNCETNKSMTHSEGVKKSVKMVTEEV